MQRRDGAGRYASMPTRPPEVALPGSPLSPGMRVTYGGIPGHRIVEVTGNVLTLRPPHGGRVIATASEVTEVPETLEERESNLAGEASVARLLASVKALSRQRREELDRAADPHCQEVLALLHRTFYDGQVDVERYVYAMRSTDGAPLGAFHAALGIVMRSQLTPRQYQALTGPARRVGAVLPV